MPTKVRAYHIALSEREVRTLIAALNASDVPGKVSTLDRLHWFLLGIESPAEFPEMAPVEDFLLDESPGDFERVLTVDREEE